MGEQHGTESIDDITAVGEAGETPPLGLRHERDRKTD
jgi:hypothetical protein